MVIQSVHRTMEPAHHPIKSLMHQQNTDPPDELPIEVSQQYHFLSILRHLWREKEVDIVSEAEALESARDL